MSENPGRHRASTDEASADEASAPVAEDQLAAPAPPLGIRGVLRHRFEDLVSQAAALGALIVVVIVLSSLSRHFLTYVNLSEVVVEATVTAMIAVGMTLVIVTAGIDLSVGSVAALAGVLGAMLMVRAHLPWQWATVGGALIGAVAGLFNGLLVSKVRLAPFIATLGMMGVARGLTYVVTGAVAVYGLPSGFNVLGQGFVGKIPVPAICLVGVILLFGFIFTRSRLGRYAYAIGSNQEAARLSGIPVGRYLVLVYALAGLLAGFGGMIATSRVSSGQPNFGDGLELDAIAAAVIGGASLFGGQGTVSGAIIGSFLIELIRDGSVLLNVNIYLQDVIIGVVVWIAVAWDYFRRRRITERRRTIRAPAR